MASSRVTLPSGRPRVAANPLLVVARAVKPKEANNCADPRSHGFGMSSGCSPLCRVRNRAHFSLWLGIPRTYTECGRQTVSPTRLAGLTRVMAGARRSFRAAGSAAGVVLPEPGDRLGEHG